VGTLIDFDNSFLGHADIWAKVGSVRVCGWWGEGCQGVTLGEGMCLHVYVLCVAVTGRRLALCGHIRWLW
jgi:hypothetical protein